MSNENECACFAAIEKINQVIVPEGDAAVGLGNSDAVRVVGAMDVDVAVIGVASGPAVYPFLQPSQPENPRCNEILLPLFRREFRIMFAGVFTANEDSAFWNSVADLFNDFVHSHRSSE